MKRGFQIADLKEKAESISRQLAAWLNSLKNTAVTGERYLTARERTRLEKRKEGEEFILLLRKEVELNRSSKACADPVFEDETAPVYLCTNLENNELYKDLVNNARRQDEPKPEKPKARLHRRKKARKTRPAP